MSADSLRLILEKGANAERLSPDEALALAECGNQADGLHRLGQAALANRRRRFGDRTTYVFNLQINPSNLCEGTCSFCRYAVKPDDPRAYVLDEEEILNRIHSVQPSEVHVVGGLNRAWDFRRCLGLTTEVRRRWPDIWIKAFTAVEVDWFAKSESLTHAETLAAIKEAGVDALTGGGAELFSERIRNKLCPDKLPGRNWLELHELAHRMGLSTNATMLYGVGEIPAERVEHLIALRDAQDRGGGFKCFIPLAWQNGDRRPPVSESLATIALSRLVLDNFPHVKAYWPMIGLETAAAAFSWGADDLDGTLGEERIAHAAGASSPLAMTHSLMRETIHQAGFQPAERDGDFNLMRRLASEPAGDEHGLEF